LSTLGFVLLPCLWQRGVRFCQHDDWSCRHRRVLVAGAPCYAPLSIAGITTLRSARGANNCPVPCSTSPPAWVSLPLPTVRYLLTSRHGLAPLPPETVSVFLNCRLQAGQPFPLPPPLVRHPFTSQDMASVSPAGDDHGLFELPASGRPTPFAAYTLSSPPLHFPRHGFSLSRQRRSRSF